VLSPLKYWLVVEQVAGVATFRELAPDMAAFVAGAVGSTPGTLCAGDDPRLGAGGGLHAASHAPGGADALATAAPAALTPGDSSAEGSANAFARADHTHAIAPFGSSSGTFCAGDDARLGDARTPTLHSGSHAPDASDALPTAAPPQGIGSGNTAGSASSYARSDHDHMLRETAGPTDLTIGAIQDGQFLKRSGTEIVSAALATTRLWVPDAQPASPSAFDDEFDGAQGAALGASWSEWDVPGIVSPDLDGQGRLRMRVPSGPRRMVGIYQAVPGASEYAIYTKARIRTHVNSGGGVACGIFLAGDLDADPSTADLRFFCTNLHAENTQSIRLFSLGAFDDGATPIESLPGTLVAAIYLRLRVNGDQYGLDFCTDGATWLQIRPSAGSANTAQIGITPVHMGLAGWNGNAGRDAELLCDFFRVVTGPGTSDLYRNDLGRELALSYT